MIFKNVYSTDIYLLSVELDFECFGLPDVPPQLKYSLVSSLLHQMQEEGMRCTSDTQTCHMSQGRCMYTLEVSTEVGVEQNTGNEQ